MTLLFSLLILVLTLAFDKILASISLVIFLPAFETEVAGSTVLYPLRLLFGAEIRSNRVQTAHNGIYPRPSQPIRCRGKSYFAVSNWTSYQILSETKWYVDSL